MNRLKASLKRPLLLVDKLCALAAIPIVLWLVVSLARTPLSLQGYAGQAANNAFSQRAIHNSHELMFGAWILCFLLMPLIRVASQRLTVRLRPAQIAICLLAACVFVSAFIVHEGRHQFGGFDYSGLIEIGWRQIQGQHLYTDFIAPTPPGFDLGIKAAFEIFGVSWNANLYFTAIFSCVTLLWSYWLLRKLRLSPMAALSIAFTMISTTMLLLSFWWYNNTALLLAAIFLLACMAYLEDSETIGTQVSYVAALTLAFLMKPNSSGPAIALGLPLLFIASPRRRRLLELTAIALLVLAAVFVINHISVAALLADYREAAHDRGNIFHFGTHRLGGIDGQIVRVLLVALTLPWLFLLPGLLRSLQQRRWAAVASRLFFPVAFVVTAYAVRTNGEFWIVEYAPVIALAGALAHRPGSGPRWMTRIVDGAICGALAFSLHQGAIRFRVFTIGPNQFFEVTNNENKIDSGFLKDMRVGAPLIEIEQEIGAAVQSNPGPYFLGPRIDFNYAALRLPAPLHLPVWWDPGTSFASSRQAALVQEWQHQRFRTLIFLKDDYTFYPPEFLDAIHGRYSEDDRYPQLTVYHLRPDAP